MHPMLPRPDDLMPDERERAACMIARLRALAQRVEGGESPNPTALLWLRNTRLSRATRIRYRSRWIAQLIERRRDTASPALMDLLETAHALVTDRQDRLFGRALDRNREAGARLALRIHAMQPGRVRLSHYCSRRTGSDTELLAVEFYAQALDWQSIDGWEDYLAALYCICRQPDLRYRFAPNCLPALRELADDWTLACGLEGV